MVKLKGSTVIEMAYLMPVVLLCWMAIIFALFYYHDKNIIGGAAYETAIVGSEEWRWQKEIEDGTYLIQAQDTTVKIQIKTSGLHYDR